MSAGETPSAYDSDWDSDELDLILDYIARGGVLTD